MSKSAHLFRYAAKSKFVRSVFVWVLSVFMVVSIAIVAIVFSSFTSEISRNIIADRQRQLADTAGEMREFDAEGGQLYRTLARLLCA